MEDNMSKRSLLNPLHIPNIARFGFRSSSPSLASPKAQKEAPFGMARYKDDPEVACTDDASSSHEAPSQPRQRKGHCLAILMALALLTVTGFLVTFTFQPNESPRLNILKALTKPLTPYPCHPTDIVALSKLPKDVLPTHENGKRLVIVGDVHGQLRPLQQLLEKTHFNTSTDHLVLTGDTIAKGPDPRGM